MFSASHVELGKVHEKMENYKRAIYYYKIVHSQKSSSPFSMYRLSRCLEKIEDYESSIKFLNEIVEQVVLKRFAEKSNLTLKKVKDELSRSLDERSAMSVKLQELMVKISTLPEIYQRVLFSADGNGDFYDQVADDESSIFSSWF